MTENLCIMRHAKPKKAQYGYICANHYEKLGSALEDILELYALLFYFYEPGTATDDGRQVHGTRIDPAAPVRLDVVALMDPRTKKLHPEDPVPVSAIIGSWAQLIREERNLDIPTTTTYLSQEIHLLSRHWAWIVEQPWVDDFANEIRDCQTALKNAIGEHPPRPVGRCPITSDQGTCDGALYQDRYGRLGVTCRKCGEVWGETELQRLGLILSA
jgi:hypothetical protein